MDTPYLIYRTVSPYEYYTVYKLDNKFDVT